MFQEMYQTAINADYARFRYGGGRRSMSEAVRLCRDAGFLRLDISPETDGENWRDDCRRLAEEIASLGMTVEQTHAPFNRYKKEDAALHKEKVRRMNEVSAILGAKYVVYHADEFSCPAGTYSSEKALAFEREYFLPLVEHAASLGVTVAFENLFEGGGRLAECDRFRCCSTVEELLAVTEMFRDYRPGVCWDFGHAHVAFGAEDAAALRKAAPQVVCTHVHDNYYGSDLHLVPFLGGVDWTAQMNCLREADYRGLLSLELVYGRAPDTLLPEYLAYAHRAAETLASM